MRAHFVTFMSPGTFYCEETEKPIESWDIEKAKKMASEIVERYGATPFAFKFSTRFRSDDELDSRVVDKSCIYYLGGKIETIEDVRERNDPSERILLNNMESNGWGSVIVNTNSWKVTQPFREGDVVLEWEKGEET